MTPPATGGGAGGPTERHLSTAVAVFAVVYLGMLLGGLPTLQMDRTGVALLGAMVLLVTGAVTLDEAVAAVDVPTLALLFGMMVLSAQLRLGGFYRTVAARAARRELAPVRLCGALVAVVGLLAAVFTNDIVCLAVAPVVIAVTRRRGLDPVPFLLAVACAANVGSALTLIGNPQNVLVGQVLRLSFPTYVLVAAGPVALGLAATWLIVAWRYRGRWTDGAAFTAPPPADAEADLDPWQAGKGLALAALAMLAFLLTEWPRELVALSCAAIVLMSRRFHTRRTLGLVDWELLVLFVGLFVVNHAFMNTGVTDEATRRLAALGIPLAEPGWLFVAATALSNLVSNVPAVMLLLPVAADPLAGWVLALASTLAGNLLIVGSIANIIVVDQASRGGIRIGWTMHATVGVPVTLATLALAALGLWVAAGLAA